MFAFRQGKKVAGMTVSVRRGSTGRFPIGGKRVTCQNAVSPSGEQLTKPVFSREMFTLVLFLLY